MYKDRIIVDQDILVGKPLVRGTRISVELVLKRLTQDLTVEGLLEAYPRLTREDIRACVEYAQAPVAGGDNINIDMAHNQANGESEVTGN